MQCDFDVIVVGGGAGGAVFASACAAAGRQVLLLERGARPAVNGPHLSERLQLIDKAAYDDREVCVNGLPRRLYMGGVLGGGTAMYGSALLRPGTDDFHPGSRYGSRLSRYLWDWPFRYDELEPFYAEAERLFRLTGIASADFGPLHPPQDGLDDRMLPLVPINQRLIDRNRAAGLRPFRLPLAIDTQLCQRCDACAGYLCPYDARRSAAQVIDETAARHSLTVLTRMDVLRLNSSASGKIESVTVSDRENGIERQFTGRIFALAAGAIGSAAVALKSGFDGPHVGRNYMLHYSPVAVGIFARPTGAGASFVKQVGFADYYFGTPDCPHKMGIIQSLPAPGPLMLQKSGLSYLPRRLLNVLRQRLLPLVGIVEDLPHPENRVIVKPDGSLGLHHLFSDFDRQRGAALGRAMCQILKRTGAVHCASRPFPSLEHVAHQCGTLRSGADPTHAVVDSDCRWFGKPNLFVVDGSVLPTSLGVGPALTIMANALRVSRVALALI
ncbi:MAG: GMC family oxidoreductase [Planctomycetes bacterium]|nr:GMC family oxidoreductase [Planctomycetota bacterium]